MAPKFKQGPKDSDSWMVIPPYLNPHIEVITELQHDKHLIVQGTIIAFKNVHGTFRFRNVAKNHELGTSWIDTLSVKTGQWKSFRVDELKGPVIPKKRRTYKNK